MMFDQYEELKYLEKMGADIIDPKSRDLIVEFLKKQSKSKKLQTVKVDTGNCYDEVLQKEFNSRLPKGKSYVTEKELQGPRKLTQEEKERRHTRMLEQTQTDLLKKKVNRKMKELELEMKRQDQAEKLEERQKMYATNVIEDAEAQQPHFIKKAKLFANVESYNNIKKLEVQAQML